MLLKKARKATKWAQNWEVFLCILSPQQSHATMGCTILNNTILTYLPIMWKCTHTRHAHTHTCSIQHGFAANWKWKKIYRRHQISHTCITWSRDIGEETAQKSRFCWSFVTKTSSRNNVFFLLLCSLFSKGWHEKNVWSSEWQESMAMLWVAGNSTYVETIRD